MNISDALALAAEQECMRFERKALGAEKEIADLEKKKAALKTAMDTAKLASQRLLNFHVVDGVNYQCPRCWIGNEIRSALRPLDGDDRRDFMGCRACGFVLEIQNNR